MKRLYSLPFVCIFALALGACSLGPDITLLDVVANEQAATAKPSAADLVDNGTSVDPAIRDAQPLALVSAEVTTADPGLAILEQETEGRGSVEPASLDQTVQDFVAPAAVSSGVALSAQAQKEATIAYLKALGAANAAAFGPNPTVSAAYLRRLAQQEQASALAEIEAGGLEKEAAPSR